MTHRPPVPSIADQLAAAGVSPRDVRLPGTPRRKQRAVRQPTTIAAGPTVWVYGSFGGKSHQWAEGVKGDCTGWLSRCGRVQRSSPPDGKRGNECELCKAKEEAKSE